MKKIFIDGNSGTTGLKIEERLSKRDDIEILKIDYEKRRDLSERKKLINESDISFFCLPDESARESANLLENDKTILIDTSTAHRVSYDWTYGFLELSKENREKIKTSKKIANVGCHAVGFISIVNPLTRMGVLPKDYPVFAHSITGYSGGGKPLIAEYEDNNRSDEYKAPRQYGLNLKHKHLPEMQRYGNLDFTPIFNPILGDYYSGMAVSIPLQNRIIKTDKNEIVAMLREYYKNDSMISIYDDDHLDSKINPTSMSGFDDMEIVVYGNDEQIEIVSLFDNLGKGASGSAIQIMNVVMGLDESYGLNIKTLKI